VSNRANPALAPVEDAPLVAVAPAAGELASYRRLADIFHQLLEEQGLESLLDRIADTLADLVPYDALTVYEADEPRRRLTPLFSRDRWAEEILSTSLGYGEGITGWAVERREAVLVHQAHLDPRVSIVPGTPPDEPEALVSVPLVARGTVKGALNIYRLGEDVAFGEDEFELAKRFGDAAALALDNAHVRARLERQAQTDSLTGLYNHRYFHERLRAELSRASRSHDSVALLMLDIDDFKKVNDVYGHGAGDQTLARLASILGAAVRASDVVCRVGGEEFGVIMPSCAAEEAVALAHRLTAELGEGDFEAAGKLTVSVGISYAPDHAMNPRELTAFADAAMMTAKSRGKDQIVVFDEEGTERPDALAPSWRDVRSVAQLKMLQSLAGKLNRLNEVRRIGQVIVNELRTLVDYHNCRVYVVEGDELVPIAFRGDLGHYQAENVEVLRCGLGEGVTGTVAATGRSLLIRNALECEFALQVPGTEEIEESMVVVPLLYGSRVIGVITLSKLGIRQFDDDDVRLLEVLAGQASVALENARLYEAQRLEAERARESAEIANALLEFSSELAAAEGIDDVLGRIAEPSARILGAPRTSVWLDDPATGELVAKAAWGYEGHEAEGRLRQARFSRDVISGLFDREEPRILAPADLLAVLGSSGRDMETSFAVAPLRTDGRLGCIAAAIPPGSGFDARKTRLLAGIADQAKLALASAGTYERLERTFVSTVESLANALEANDEYTSSHARSISDMAIRVGAELGLEAKALKRLELAALFHDIGKIGVPNEILSKPGPLTEDEWAVLRRHPELGETILAPIDRLADVRPIVRHCHERFDGHGYPDAKAGTEIPIEARIIFVCDAFHAMTTDRPYRPRLSEKEAFRRLRRSAGTQFDPDIVGVFLNLMAAAASAAA
jgi:diguanylate cyclase (GGDEF)-like protein